MNEAECGSGSGSGSVPTPLRNTAARSLLSGVHTWDRPRFLLFFFLFPTDLVIVSPTDPTLCRRHARTLLCSVCVCVLRCPINPRWSSSSADPGHEATLETRPNGWRGGAGTGARPGFLDGVSLIDELPRVCALGCAEHRSLDDSKSDLGGPWLLRRRAVVPAVLPAAPARWDHWR